MDKADALRAMIERVEGGTGSPAAATTVRAFGRKDATHLFWEVVNNGSLNAVARLEAPLRERGFWQGVQQWTEFGDFVWRAEWTGPNGQTHLATAPTEARARLLAVLRAMLHEEPPHAD